MRCYRRVACRPPAIPGQTASVPNLPVAELSSVATALEELAARVSSMADGLSGGRREGKAADLYEIERALGAAHRRLTKLVSEA